MKTCPACGRPNPDGNSYCDQCAFTLVAEGTVVRIGRDPDNDLVLPADLRQVGRRQASVSVQGGRLVIADQGTANGTFVNGRRISEPTPFGANDEIRFGSYVFSLEKLKGHLAAGQQARPPAAGSPRSSRAVAGGIPTQRGGSGGVERVEGWAGGGTASRARIPPIPGCTEPLRGSCSAYLCGFRVSRRGQAGQVKSTTSPPPAGLRGHRGA